MDGLLSDLVGTKIDLWSGGGGSEHVDHGTLEAFDGQWCRVRDGSDQVLCFPISNIRLVKGRPQGKVGLPLPSASNNVQE
jgi:hypothetical protein